MKTAIKVNGKKVSKKVAVKLIGKERLEERINDAIATYYNDPMESNTWMDGMELIITE